MFAALFYILEENFFILNNHNGDLNPYLYFPNPDFANGLIYILSGKPEQKTCPCLINYTYIIFKIYFLKINKKLMTYHRSSLCLFRIEQKMCFEANKIILT